MALACQRTGIRFGAAAGGLLALAFCLTACGSGSGAASPQSTSAATTISGVQGLASQPTKASSAVASPGPTPLPATWPDGLQPPLDGVLESIACLDATGDGRINGADAPDLAGLDIPLQPGACEPSKHADYFVSAPSDAARFACGSGPAPLLIVSVASAGSDLLAPKEGESMGLLDILNRIRAQAHTDGIATQTILATPAVLGAAKQAQTNMERWVEHDLRARLDATPCLRAALIGHSHGAVTVTSVMAALESAFPGRLFGVLIDRTTVLYDRPATEMPATSPLLNFYQTNEGWHGSAIDQPNVENHDESAQEAPVAPSDGGGGIAPVTHKTLDDAAEVQRLAVSGVMRWATGGR